MKRRPLGDKQNGHGVCRDRLRKVELATKTEAFDQLSVTLFRLSLEVIEKFAALGNHGQEATAAGEIFFVLTHVGGEEFDPLGQNGDLVIGASGVCF